jgi:tetratricopeptide (TPR) repeat protein
LALSDQAIEDLDPRLLGQAVMALEAVLPRDANDVDVLRSLGFLYGHARNHAKARSAFEAALQADPHDEMSLKNLGLMAYRTRSFDSGRRSYEAYLRLNKWDATMSGPYVALLAASGDLQAAVEAAERGLRLDPTERELRRVAAQLYARIGDRKKSQQHRDILREISNRLDPWDQKRRDRLREQMQKSLERDP